VSVQDWRTVYAKRTIGSEIILDAHDGTTGDVGDKAQAKACFGLFGDSANLDTR
jgi:hypothetical protein